MNDRLQHTGQALVHEMGLNEPSIDRRKKIVGFEAADLKRIASIQDLVVRHADDFTAAFFNHLSNLEEGRPLLSSRALMDRARALKKEHLLGMVGGDYGPKYVEQRVELALLYARAGLDTRAFLGAFQNLLYDIGAAVTKHFERQPIDGFEAFASLMKIAFFDVGVITDVLVFERERTIRQQQDAIRELSTPVLQVRDRLLLLPIIGVIDTHRARSITESLLRAIRANRAKVVVMDVTGVATIDSRVANHILQTVTAVRLMGAQVIITGLSSEVAQSLAALGIELSKLITIGDLQGGLEEAERVLGYRVYLANGAAPPPHGPS